MSSIINASTTSGLVQTADTSGTLELQSNGTTQLTLSSTGTYGQLKSYGAVSASGTSVDFTSIPSWVKRVTVLFSGVSTNGTSDFIVQLGDSGGVETTGYAASMISVAGASSGTAYTTGLGLSGSVAASSYSGQVIISLANSSTNAWVYTSTITSGTGTVNVGTGSKSLSATLDSVRITTVGGANTFDAGSINIFYEG